MLLARLELHHAREVHGHHGGDVGDAEAIGGQELAAGEACVSPDPAGVYRAALDAELLPEMAAGERCLVAFERRPRAFHELITRTPPGWRGFVRLASGDTTLARAMKHPGVRLGLGLLSR